MDETLKEVESQCLSCFKYDRVSSSCRLGRSNLFGECPEFLQKQLTRKIFPTLEENIEVLRCLRLCEPENLSVRYDSQEDTKIAENPDRSTLLQFIADISDFPFVEDGFTFVLGYLKTLQPYMLEYAVVPENKRYEGLLYVYNYPALTSAIIIKVNVAKDLSVVVSFHKSRYTMTKLDRLYAQWGNTVGVPCLDEYPTLYLGIDEIWTHISGTLQGDIYYVDLVKMLTNYREGAMEELNEFLSDVMYSSIRLSKLRKHGAISVYSVMLMSFYNNDLLNELGTAAAKLEVLRLTQSSSDKVCVELSQAEFDKLKTAGIVSEDLIVSGNIVLSLKEGED